MESSFRTRVDRAFGFMLGSIVHHHQAGEGRESTAERPESSAAAPNFWSVSERPIFTESFPRSGDEDTGDESDGNAAADYQRFVRLERRGRRRRRFDLTADEPEEGDSEEERRERKRRREGEYEGDAVVDINTEDDEDEEVREMRRMIGRDCTLDFEEEEDEYDKVAVGREGAGERMYMREVTCCSLDICHLPPGHSGALGTFERDSRANHAAAAARLKEDKEAEARYNVTATNGSPTVSQVELPSVSRTISCLKRRLGDKVISEDGGDQGNDSASDTPGELVNADKVAEGCEEGKRCDPEEQSEKDSATLDSNRGEVGETCGEAEDGSNTKRKGRKGRTVRFAVPEDPLEERKRDSLMPTDRNQLNRIWNDYRVPSNVPDHVRNPSKYTHYTLEWSDDEDDSKKNMSAFQCFKASTHEPEKTDASFKEASHSITFTPKFVGTSVKSNLSAVERSKKDSPSVQVQPSVTFAEAVLEDDLNSKTSPIEWNRLSEGKTARVFRKRAIATLEDGVDNENIDSPSG